jgi:hypothetical protein
MTKSSRHSQRTTLPPRCSFTAQLKRQGSQRPFVQTCRQPATEFIDGAPFCTEHAVYHRLLQADFES